jgi:hypothetical protein
MAAFEDKGAQGGQMKYYQIAALILLCAFYITYIAKMILLRKHGIQGSILGKNALEKALRVVTGIGVIVQFGSTIFPNYIGGFPSFPTMHEDRLILMALGVAAFIVAVVTMQNNWRAGFNESQNTKLVTDGIYRFSRNPAFVGFDSHAPINNAFCSLHHQSSKCYGLQSSRMVLCVCCVRYYDVYLINSKRFYPFFSLFQLQNIFK